MSNGNSRDDEFVYNKDAGTMQCPKGHLTKRCDIHNGKYNSQYSPNIKIICRDIYIVKISNSNSI